MKWTKWLSVGIAVGMLATAGCGDDKNSNSPVAPSSSDDVVGSWEYSDGSFSIMYRSNGTYVDGNGDEGFNWSLEGDTIVLSISDSPIYVYKVLLEGDNKMTLTPVCSDWSIVIRDSCPESPGEFKRL
jgi:hypothetical protein